MRGRSSGARGSRALCLPLPVVAKETLNAAALGRRQQQREEEVLKKKETSCGEQWQELPSLQLSPFVPNARLATVDWWCSYRRDELREANQPTIVALSFSSSIDLDRIIPYCCCCHTHSTTAPHRHRSTEEVVVLPEKRRIYVSYHTVVVTLIQPPPVIVTVVARRWLFFRKKEGKAESEGHIEPVSKKEKTKEQKD
ncbi:hypothetical protein BHE74_00017082 [Ensete ventricosum]|nr:hypothetical protein BHE74_00017082 [Ensete ventricosum]